MRSSSPYWLRRSLALRLTMWYGASFLVITMALSIISYVRLSNAVRDNRKVIVDKLRDYTAVAEQQGVDAIWRAAKVKYSKSGRRSVVLQVLDPLGKVRFQSSPDVWERYQPVDRPWSIVGAWRYVPSSHDGDVLELMTGRLPGGFVLQVGKEIQDRKEILQHYRETIIAVTAAMILIGLAGGAILAFRAMRPVRHLSQVIRSIVWTGNVDARVPVSGRGDEFDTLSRLFNQMLDRIQALITGMRDALDNVAHDLRTPLTRMRGSAEVALQGNADTERCGEVLASSIEESDRILSLLNTLVDISEAETGTMRLKLEKVNIVELIAEVAELYEYSAEEKNVSIQINSLPHIEITADQNRLRQVFANLMDNAIKYNLTGGLVIVEAQQEPNQTIVTFEDSGISIAPEDIGRIWDRLYRADKSRSQPGLGLGLSLVKAVVRAHHGTVEVQSAAGKGSTFTVALPRYLPASA